MTLFGVIMSKKKSALLPYAKTGPFLDSEGSAKKWRISYIFPSAYW